MNHRVFGKIEWRNNGRWTGRVRIDFFSGYDTVASTEFAAASGTPDEQRARDDRHRQGDFELWVLRQHGGGEPSSVQEKAFRRFLQNRDAICREVADAVFRHYQKNWKAWRTYIFDSSKTGDVLVPELRDEDGLRRVIRLESLHVLDAPASGPEYVGFCFACSWDLEHGLGVLLHDGKVVEVGENDITFWTPE